jgi:CHASE3 domain sensor protein
MSSAISAFLEKARSSALSIGQLTFSGFLCVLAVILVMGVANVVAVRHIDTTFAELQRLQAVGDLAENIDRRLSDLRLAARDYVTDPDARPEKVSEAAAALDDLLKTNRSDLAPEQGDMIDSVDVRLTNYRKAA